MRQADFELKKTALAEFFEELLGKSVLTRVEATVLENLAIENIRAAVGATSVPRSCTTVKVDGVYHLQGYDHQPAPYCCICGVCLACLDHDPIECGAIKKQFEEMEPPKKDNLNTVLDEAARLTGGERNKDYGHPRDNFNDIAKIWSVILHTEVTAEQVALCNIAIKIARQTNRSKRDNLVDIAGYARTIEMLGE